MKEAMERSMRHIGIIGAGAVGGAYGAMLYDADPACVSFVARGDRLRRLKDRGLVVNGKPYAIRVRDASDPSAPTDLLIVAVKHHQLEEALGEMRQAVGEETAILSLMNGVESEEQIGRVYGAGKVLPAIVVGIDALREGNSITYTRKGKIYFGEAGNRPRGERVRRIQALFDRAGIPHETPPDMTRTLWWKFMINVGINQVSAALRAPYGVFQTAGEARELMESAMREVVLLASRLHISLTEADVTEWYAVLRGLNPEGKTSMLQDVEGGRKTEVEMFAGKVIGAGQAPRCRNPGERKAFRHDQADRGVLPIRKRGDVMRGASHLRPRLFDHAVEVPAKELYRHLVPAGHLGRISYHGVRVAPHGDAVPPLQDTFRIKVVEPLGAPLQLRLPLGVEGGEGGGERVRKLVEVHLVSHEERPLFLQCNRFFGKQEPGALDQSLHETDEPLPLAGQHLHQLPLVLNDHIRGRGRRRGPHIGDKIGDGEIDLMADTGYYGYRGRATALATASSLKQARSSIRSAPPAQDDHVHVLFPVEILDAGHDLRACLVSLHPDRVDAHVHVPELSAYDLQHVPDRRPCGRRHDADPSGRERAAAACGRHRRGPRGTAFP